MADTRLSFGPFELDTQRGALIREGKSTPLGQRAVALLEALVEAGGVPVSKADLMGRAWPGTIVEEGNLTVQIAALRKALGNGTDGHDWIATVPRVGYRLVSPLAVSAAEAGSTQPSLAVLPFQNLSGDAEQDWFGEGVVDDIITALSRFKSFAVIARNSSFTYKGRSVDVREVAKDLGVRYVLEGSVRRAGEKLRIGAQLVDGATGVHLWGQVFDGSANDIFDFQDAITESVAILVEPRILAAEIERSRRVRPASLTAYDLMLRSLPESFLIGDESNRRACAQLADALAIEPDNTAVIARAAAALSYRTIMGWPEIGPDDRRRCVELAREGLQRAAGDATCMALCADVLLHVARDYDVAMAALKSAVDANPNDYVVVRSAGVAHLHCGTIDDALAFFHRAIKLSPRNPSAFISLCGIAHAHLILADFRECILWALEAHVVNSRYGPALWMLIAANAHLGQLAEAQGYLAEFLTVSPEVTLERIAAGQPAKDPRRIDPVLDGLRRAGLPER